MEQNIIRKNMWNTAGKAGLYLGLTSSAYLFITQWAGQAEIPAILNSLMSIILWAAKFIGCIWIMRYFMKSHTSEFHEVTEKDIFRLGMAMSFLSALVYAGVAFANVGYISSDYFSEQMDFLMQQMAPMIDSNTSAAMGKYMENLPQITFFSNLLYCFIYGTVLSSILSRNIPGKDPFADYKPEEQ